MYYEMTPFIVLICNKERVYAIFLKSKLQIMWFIHQPKISFSISEFTKYFFTSSALQTLALPDLCLLLRLSSILNISNVLFSSRLNSLDQTLQDLIKNLHPSALSRSQSSFFEENFVGAFFYLKWRQINILLSCENLSNVCFIIKVPI